MQYVVMDIGCFECGVGSMLVGIFGTPEAAENARDRQYRDHYEGDGWRDGGSAEVRIFAYEL